MKRTQLKKHENTHHTKQVNRVKRIGWFRKKMRPVDLERLKKSNKCKIDT